MLKRYKRLVGHNWACGTGPQDIPKKILNKIVEANGIESSEAILLLAYADSMGIRTAFYVVLTMDRLISGQNSTVEQCLLTDLKRLDRKATNIEVHALGNGFRLWRTLTAPKGDLVEDVYKVVNNRWLEARRQNEQAAVVVSASANGDSKSCPFCAEKVKLAAIKCRYCGSAI